jgi:hypothetical protein
MHTCNRPVDEIASWLKDAVRVCYENVKALKKKSDLLARDGKRLDIFQEQRVRDLYEPFVPIVKKTLTHFGVECLTINPAASAYDYSLDMDNCVNVFSEQVCVPLADEFDATALSKVRGEEDDRWKPRALVCILSTNTSSMTTSRHQHRPFEGPSRTQTPR